jgi:hypothetical protein
MIGESISASRAQNWFCGLGLFLLDLLLKSVPEDRKMIGLLFILLDLGRRSSVG